MPAAGRSAHAPLSPDTLINESRIFGVGEYHVIMGRVPIGCHGFDSRHVGFLSEYGLAGPGFIIQIAA